MCDNLFFFTQFFIYLLFLIWESLVWPLSVIFVTFVLWCFLFYFLHNLNNYITHGFFIYFDSSNLITFLPYNNGSLFSPFNLSSLVNKI